MNQKEISMSYFESIPIYRQWPLLQRNIHLNRTAIIEHNTPIVNIGSCFGETLQIFLDMHHFNIIESQMGYKYSCHSIMREVTRALNKINTTEDELYTCNNGYTDYNHHRIFDKDKTECLRKIQAIERNVHEALLRAEVVILTPSLTEVWRNRNTGDFILHPYPGVMRECREFELHYLSVAENLEYLEKTRSALMEYNPSIQIIANVCPTPLRATHLDADVVQANNASKATVYAAIHDFCMKNENVLYFPGFDIVNYELNRREHYIEDNRHLNPKSLQYYMNCFGKTFFSEKSLRMATLLEQIHGASRDRQRSILRELDELGYDPDLLRIKIANNFLAFGEPKQAFDALCQVTGFRESPAICLNLGLILLELGVPAKADYFFGIAKELLRDIPSLAFSMADRNQRIKLGDTHMAPYTNISDLRQHVLTQMQDLAQALTTKTTLTSMPKFIKLVFCDTFYHNMLPTFRFKNETCF